MGKIFDISDFWYRYEWQERGSGHVHGFLWLKNAPRPEDINWDLLKQVDSPVSEDQQQKMTEFKSFWDRIVSAFNPVLRQDPNAPLLGGNPCSKPTEGMINTNEELADLLNWVQRHSKCVARYCQVKRKVPGQEEPQICCRFDYPMPCHPDCAVIGRDSKSRLRFEPRRNDPLLNNYNRAMLMAWRANIDLKPVLSKDAAINYIAKYASKSEQQAPAFPEMLDGVVKLMNSGATAQLACQKLLNKMLGERSYSAQETAHLLLGIPLVRTSVAFQTLYIGEEGDMRELDEGEEAPEEAEEPQEGGRRVTNFEIHETLRGNGQSLQEVFENYLWRNNEWRKRRKQNVILRTFPRYSPNPDSDVYPKYCRTKILLHHPFRSLDELQNPPNEENVDGELSWPELWAQCRAAGHTHRTDSLRDWDNENRVTEDDDDDEEINPDVNEVGEEDWQIFARDFPGAHLPQFDANDLGSRPIDAALMPEAGRGRWHEVEQMLSYIDTNRREYGGQSDESAIRAINIDTLAEEQRNIFDKIMGQYSLELLGGKRSQALLNIDGTAGCGKTYLIHAICQELRRLAAEHDQPDPIRVLAPSGVAAFNIRGRTIHSALGLPEQWRGAHFVIIDEKSMLGLRTLSQIDSRLRQILPHRSNNVFGGLNLALVGDFAQLPPVGDRPLYAPPSTDVSDSGSMSRDGSRLYQMFTESYRLRVVHRQQGDSPEQTAFRNLLHHASKGSLSVAEWETLQTRCFSNLNEAEKASFQDSLCLFTTREDVNAINLQEIQALGEPCARIKARHDGGSEAARASADDAGGLEAQLILSCRSQVMITRNLWQEQGLVNATVGTVEDIIWPPGATTSDLLEVVLVSCKDYTGPTSWRTEPRPGFPNGIPIVPVPAVKSTFDVGGKQVSRVQIPLRLAWAVTVHKSQGLTIAKIRLGLGKKEFAVGLTFVGLSRVKALNDIAIMGSFDYSRVKNLGGKNLQYRFDNWARRYPNQN
ncbi:unnamed protein product [Mycena citricolor]|uniref:ATP-dependent DNA helicase n=1 Tax=Mycena citricolor TaxID=2018698 RepID=A0AAD2H8F2_9AGAR|nr:unnamed protein product [Mycena citricolor]